MTEPWKEVKKEIADVARDALRGFVETPAVDAFTQDRAEQYAREYWLSIHAENAEERERHLEQLAAAKERVRPDFNRLQLNIDVDAKNTVIRVYEAIGGMLIRVFPKILAAA